MLDSLELTCFIIACIVFGSSVLALFLYSPIKTILYTQFTVRMYYKTIRKVALYNDYYLINEWAYADSTPNGDSIHIDHIIFGDKFIYLIKDCYYKGAIKASLDDNSWISYPSKNKKRYIKNPLINNSKRADILSRVSGLPRDFLISITVVNDDCLITPFDNSNRSDCLVSLSKVEKLIASKEKDPNVQRLVPRELKAVVHDLAELNQKKK